MSVMGYKGILKMQKEQTFAGTVSTTQPIYMDKFTEHNLTTNNNFYRPDYIDGAFTRSDSVMGAYSAEGSLSGDCSPSGFFGLVCMGIMGTDTVTITVTSTVSGTITALATHNFTLKQTVPTYRGTMRHGDTTYGKVQIRGITFNSLQISGNKDGALTWSANYMAAYDALLSSTVTVTGTLPTVDPFMFYHVTCTINGAGGHNVEAFTLNINNNMEAIRYLTVARMRQASAIERAGKVDLALSLDVNYTTITKYKDFWGAAANPGETATTYSITLLANGFKYQATPELRYTFKIILPACEINSAPIPQSTGRVVQTLDLTPVFKSGKTYPIKMTLANHIATSY